MLEKPMPAKRDEQQLRKFKSNSRSRRREVLVKAENTRMVEERRRGIAICRNQSRKVVAETFTDA
jgi:hypothetical protein